MNKIEFFSILNDDLKAFLLTNPLTRANQGYDIEESDHKRFNEELYSRIKEIEKIYADILDENEKKSEELKILNDKLTLRNLNVKEEIISFQGKKFNQESKLHSLNQEILRYESLIAQTKREISQKSISAESDFDNNNITESIARTQEQLDSYREELTHISRKFQRKTLQINSVKRELKELEAKIQTYEEKIQRMNEKSFFIREKTRIMRESIRGLKERESELSGVCKRLQRENTRFKGGGKSDGESTIKSRPRKTSAKKKIEAIAKVHYSKLDSDGDDGSVFSGEKDDGNLLFELQNEGKDINAFNSDNNEELNSVIQECSSVDSSDCEVKNDFLFDINIFNFGLSIAFLPLKALRYI